MKKRKKHKYKFSESGGLIFLIILWIPFLIYGWLAFINTFSVSWRSLILFIIFIIFSISIWFLAIKPLVKNITLLKFFTGLSEALFSITLLFIMYGLIVLITSHTPTNYNSHYVPRSTCMKYFYIAVISFCLAYLSRLTINLFKKRA